MHDRPLRRPSLLAAILPSRVSPVLIVLPLPPQRRRLRTSVSGSAISRPGCAELGACRSMSSASVRQGSARPAEQHSQDFGSHYGCRFTTSDAGAVEDDPSSKTLIAIGCGSNPALSSGESIAAATSPWAHPAERAASGSFRERGTRRVSLTRLASPSLGGVDGGIVRAGLGREEGIGTRAAGPDHAVVFADLDPELHRPLVGNPTASSAEQRLGSRAPRSILITGAGG